MLQAIFAILLNLAFLFIIFDLWGDLYQKDAFKDENIRPIVYDFARATRVRRIILLIPPVGLIVCVVWFISGLVQYTLNFINNGKNQKQ